MKNIIFVHGIGVRQPAYGNSFEKVEKNLVGRLGEGNVSVHKCYWGGSEGAKLHAGGASVPSYYTTRANQTHQAWLGCSSFAKVILLKFTRL